VAGAHGSFGALGTLTELDALHCTNCREEFPPGSFRKHAKTCAWCTFASKAKRAKFRYRDKQKTPKSRLNISLDDFVAWYEAQLDECAYCGLTFAELKSLRIKRGRWYCVAWDIDRINSGRPYELGNLALSCFVCNMAKGDVLNADEARLIGATIRGIWRARLARTRV
jgi:5-methylcytosine-specific restriction endonuclease McrA